MSYKAVALTLSTALALQACAGATSSPPASTPPAAQGTPAKSKDAALRFLYPKDAYANIAQSNALELAASSGVLDLPQRDGNTITLARLDAKPENRIWQACGGHPPSGNKALLAPFLVPIVGWAISQAATWVVGAIDSALQADVKRYTVTHAVQSDAFDFYDVLSDGKGFRGEQPAVACFRLTQSGPSKLDDPKSAPTLYMDFIGQISFDPKHPQIIAIKPVRLFYARDVTPSSDGQAAIDIKIAADVVWLSDSGGETATGTMNKSVVAAKINVGKLSDSNYLYTVYDLAKVPAIEVPLPKYDYLTSARAPRDNRMRLTATVTEVGNVPWLLKNAASLFDKNKSGVTQDLINLGDKYAGVTKPGSTSKSP
jgi:hypothetical protein